MAAKPDDIRRTIDGYASRMTAGDKDGWLALFAPDATIEDPVGSDVRVGRHGASEFWDFTRSLSADIELTLTGPVRVVGDEAAFPFKIITTVGDDRFRLDVIDTMTFDEDAKIRTMRAFWDMADMRPADG
jgi:steroid delta-isomerase